MKWFCGCLLGFVLIGAAAPASAADDVGLSLEGTQWSSSLNESLFDPNFRWIPGDDETASFYVRNQGPTRALLTIGVRSVDADDLLADDDIALRARVADGDWVALDNGVPSASLTERSIARGGVVRVDVNATFDPASTNQSQTKQLRLAFDVTLTDSLEGVDDSADDHSGVLPGAGSNLGLWIVPIAAGALALGAWILIARRRYDEVRHG